METDIKEGEKVEGIRTFNNDKIQGTFYGYHNISKKGEYIVGVIYVQGERAYDVFPNSLVKLTHF